MDTDTTIIFAFLAKITVPWNKTPPFVRDNKLVRIDSVDIRGIVPVAVPVKLGAANDNT